MVARPLISIKSDSTDRGMMGEVRDVRHRWAMRILDIKLFRDLGRLWAQALAIALVVAGGFATIILAVGSYRSLEETRTAYYDRYMFADVFAKVRRAPTTLVGQIAGIPGVVDVEARIEKLALLDIPDVREPATGRFISLPESGEPLLNRLYLRGSHAGNCFGNR
jgi:putative ABC transport system permease protein